MMPWRRLRTDGTEVHLRGDSRSQKCQRKCQQEPSRRVGIGFVRLTNVSFEYRAKTPVYYSDLSAKALVFNVRQEGPNDPSSATRPTRALDCNREAMAGLEAWLGVILGILYQSAARLGNVRLTTE